MLQFFKYVLATLVGLFVFIFLFFVIIVGISSAVSSGDSVTTVKENSVLRLNLNQQIVENAPSEDPLAALLQTEISKVGLVDLKSTLANAKLDPNIKGIYLDLEFPQAGYGTLEELRASLLDFKESGKFIYTYAEGMSEKAVYISSVSDRIFVNEWGGVEFNGLSAEITFYKGLFDKIGIKPMVFKVGEFKSAVEPYILNKMSESNRKQVTSYIGSIADHIYSQIADSRGMTKAEIDEVLASNVQSAQEAQEMKIITDVAYYDEFETALREELDIDEDAKINFISQGKYAKAKNLVKLGDRNQRIAVIIGQGTITTGESNSEGIGSDSWIKELRKAVKDSKVKAIVLRINSGGGSALASDVMWREIELAKEKKPVYASMGDYAASGGYYMAMACDTIVADHMTLTGSIGIFGIMVNAKELMNNKLGITFDGVETHEHANFPNLMGEMSTAEKMTIQNIVDQGYEKFTSKAAAGRGMDIDELKAIAEGRVWTGEQAIENGLVDVLGSLEDAVEIAAKGVCIEDDYRVRYYPTPKSDIQIILDKISNQGSLKLEQKLGLLAPYLKEINEIQKMDLVQARMGYEVTIE